MKDTIMIFIDSLTWEGVEQMPYLNSLKKKGFNTTIKSTIPANTSVANPSFTYALSPGETGIISSKINDKILNYKIIPVSPFWDKLGKSLIVGLCITHPPFIKNGVMVVGELPDPKFISYPYNNFFKDFHCYREKMLELQKDPLNNGAKLVSIYNATSNLQYSLFKQHYQENNFDFAIFRFYVTDEAQHFISYNQEYLNLVYKYVDDKLKDVVTSFPDKNIIFFSDHGYERTPDKIFYINTWLMKKGYLKVNPILLPLLAVGQKIVEKTLPLSFLGKILQKKNEFKTLKDDLTDEYNLRLPGINWKKTTAYLSKPWGISCDDPDKLIIDMQELIKQGIVREVYKKKDLYKGSKLHLFPDIIFTLNGSEYASVRPNLGYKLFGKLKPTMSGHHDHYNKGIFIATGPDKNKFKDVVNIWDIGTIMIKENWRN